MKTIEDYQDPFDAVEEFEQAMCDFTGAPFAITTDCCTHALEIALRIKMPTSTVGLPCRTYLSVLMTMHKLGIVYELKDISWRGEYQIHGTDIWDSARRTEKNMYRKGQIQCLSFGRTKPLEVGRGGMILTDDPEIYFRASRMRYDGRDIRRYQSWIDQQNFELGFHYYMRPEECVRALNKLKHDQMLEQQERFYNYPDCRKISIKF